MVSEPPNRGMKLTSAERIGRWQLMPGVRWTNRRATERTRPGKATHATPAAWASVPTRPCSTGVPRRGANAHANHDYPAPLSISARRRLKGLALQRGIACHR